MISLARNDAQTASPRRLAGADLVAALSAPRSIAIVGASTDPSSYSSRTIEYLEKFGYRGRIELVNPRRTEIGGRPVRSTVAELAADPVDVGFVAVPGAAAVTATEELSNIGVPVVVVIAGGLTDVQKDRLREIAASTGTRIIGPECIGTICVATGAFLSYSKAAGRQQLTPGSTALITQSGAMGNSLLISLVRRGVNISHWISTGGETDIGAMELAAGLLRDPSVETVAIFCEGVTDPSWLPEVRSAIEETGKAVFLVKTARTDAGKHAAGGHTGRVVGSADISLPLLREAGIVDLETMVALADALVVRDRLPAVPGERVAVVSLSGGSGVLTADAISVQPHLSLAELRDDKTLAARLAGRVTAIDNPMDVPVTDESEFVGWVAAVAQRPQVDAVVAIQGRILHDEQTMVHELIASRATSDAAVLVVPFNEDDAMTNESIYRLASEWIPVVPTPERAVAALENVRRAARVAAAVDETHAHGPSSQGIEAAIGILGDDLPWAPFEIVASVEQAEAATRRLGAPVVLKAAGRTLEHRSDVGAVRTGIEVAQIAEAFGHVKSATAPFGDAIMVQKQVRGDLELMLSIVTDPEFGLVALVRLGGVMTELLAAEPVVLWPGWSASQRKETLRRSLIGTLLGGFRGRPKLDLDAVAQLIERLLTRAESGATEFVEFNPVLIGGDGVHLVDALIRTQVTS